VTYTEQDQIDPLYAFVAQSAYESKQEVHNQLKQAAADHSVKATLTGKRLHRQLM